jgi:hypothetical protein
MREHPILFGPEDVALILGGRKTQTRRVINPQPIQSSENPCYVDWQDGSFSMDDAITRYAPYQPGDRLWVRESWGIFERQWTDCGWENQGLVEFSTKSPQKELVYSSKDCIRSIVYAADGYQREVGYEPGFKASIHMPRWVSRITLEVKSVRIERLQSISESDCAEEGCSTKYTRDYKKPQFKFYWTQLGGNWDENPFVWVIEFEMVKS